MLKNLNQQTPGYKTNLLLSIPKLTADELIDKLKKCGVTGVGANVPAALTAEYVKKVKDAGFEFHVWTIDNPARAVSLCNLGVDSITTNVPVKIKEALSRNGKQ